MSWRSHAKIEFGGDRAFLRTLFGVVLGLSASKGKRAGLYEPSSPHSEHLFHPKYRADIDGLRALAVLSVVGFHAFPNLITGGFVGVDVFFVISGFLISSILFRSFETGAFDFLEFYKRRIRRIFPALFVVLLFCYTVGWFGLLADEFKQLGKHIAAAAAFVANFVFWDEAGYFDKAAITKPLLHLWSLGIEEQFYIIWPLLLWCAWRVRINLLVVTLAGLIASFIFNASHVGTGGVEIFYSPQTRFWELLVGAALANVSLRAAKTPTAGPFSAGGSLDGRETDGGVFPAKALSDTLGLCGCAMLCIAIFAISPARSYPGYWALLPTIGTALIIAAGPFALLNRLVFSNKAAVWVGLISYPLYLWHWPLLSFANILQGGAPPLAERLAIVALSIGLAWLTYVFVERPIRFASHRSFKTGALCVLMATIALGGYDTYRRDGLRFRAAEMRQSAIQRQWFDPDSACLKKTGLIEGLTVPSAFCSMTHTGNAIKVALIGDSTANHLYPGMARLFSQMHVGVINLGRSTCAPFNNLVYEAEHDNDCTIINRRIYALLEKDPDIKAVILAFAPWDIDNMGFYGRASSKLSRDDKFAIMADQIKQDIKILARPDRQLIVTYDAPRIDVDVAVCVRNPHNPKCNIAKSDQDAHWGPFISAYGNIFSQHSEVCDFRQADILLSDQGTYRLFIDKKLTFRDPYHYTIFGSDLVAEAFAKSRCFSLVEGKL